MFERKLWLVHYLPGDCCLRAVWFLQQTNPTSSLFGATTSVVAVLRDGTQAMLDRLEQKNLLSLNGWAGSTLSIGSFRETCPQWPLSLSKVVLRA